MLSPFTVLPTVQKVICELRKPGYVLLGAVTANSPLLTCRVEIETDGEMFLEEFTCVQLLAAGWVQAMTSGWWVSGNFPLVPSFTASFTPSPWWPVGRSVKISLVNNTAAPIIATSAVLCIVLETEKT